MFARFEPKSALFYDLFNSSAQLLATGAKTLTELHDPEPAFDAIAQRMADLEHDADSVTHDLFRTLNSSFITPFDRTDIYILGSSLDDVMDHMDAATQLLSLYRIDELTPQLHDMIDILDVSAKVTADAMPRLASMKDLERYWIEINELENRADASYRTFLADLFGGRFDALTVMKLKDVGDELEDAADAFEKVAHVIESIVLKET